MTGSSCGAATFVKSSDGVTTTLDPGATWTFTCTETLTGSVTDIASASGTDVADGQPAPPETASASVTVTNPMTTLSESADASLVRTGTSVTFTYLEKNTGVDPLTGVTVTGSSCGAATFVNSSDGVTTTLDPAATWTFTCTETLTDTGTSALTVTDNATAKGTDTVDNSAAPVETAKASVKVINPATSLTESASANTVRAGSSVTFTYKETNTGSDPLTGITVTGSSCGAATFVSSSDGVISQLNPGATWTFTCTEAVTGSGPITDNASATGTDSVDGKAAPAESATVSVTGIVVATTLSESASASVVRTGSAVTFTYTETNDGSDPLSGVTVTGSSCGAATFVKSSDTVTTVLDPGATWTFTCTETLTNTGTSDLTVTDNATATGTDTVDNLPAGPETAMASVTVTNPTTTLKESATPPSVIDGTSVLFTYTEKNTARTRSRG